MKTPSTTRRRASSVAALVTLAIASSGGCVSDGMSDPGSTTRADEAARPLVLDFEYKKIKPGQLIVKQVRKIPQATTAPNVAPFLLKEPARLCTAQGEASDVFAVHRGKAHWALDAQNIRLTPANLTRSVLGGI